MNRFLSLHLIFFLFFRSLSSARGQFDLSCLTSVDFIIWMGLILKPASFVFSWAADWAGGEELREREESSREGIWRQKSGTEGKLNCRTGGEEEDDWKWEINNGADGRWERAGVGAHVWALSPVWNRFNLGCFFFSQTDSMEVKPIMTRKLRRRPNDPVPIPDKRRKPAPDTLSKRPLLPQIAADWADLTSFERVVPGTECCSSVDDVVSHAWPLTPQASSLILCTSVKLFAHRWPDHGGSEDAKQGKRPFVAWKVCRVLSWLIFFRSIYFTAQVTQTARWVRTPSSCTGIYNCHPSSCLHSQYNKG